MYEANIILVQVYPNIVRTTRSLMNDTRMATLRNLGDMLQLHEEILKQFEKIILDSAHPRMRDFPQGNALALNGIVGKDAIHKATAAEGALAADIFLQSVCHLFCESKFIR